MFSHWNLQVGCFLWSKRATSPWPVAAMTMTLQLSTGQHSALFFAEVAFLEFFSTKSPSKSWAVSHVCSTIFPVLVGLKLVPTTLHPWIPRSMWKVQGCQSYICQRLEIVSNNVSLGVKLLCFASIIDWFTTHYYICLLLLYGQHPFEAQKCILFFGWTCALTCSDASRQWVQLRVCGKVN